MDVEDKMRRYWWDLNDLISGRKIPLDLQEDLALLFLHSIQPGDEYIRMGCDRETLQKYEALLEKKPNKEDILLKIEKLDIDSKKKDSLKSFCDFNHLEVLPITQRTYYNEEDVFFKYRTNIVYKKLGLNIEFDNKRGANEYFSHNIKYDYKRKCELYMFSPTEQNKQKMLDSLGKTFEMGSKLHRKHQIPDDIKNDMKALDDVTTKCSNKIYDLIRSIQEDSSVLEYEARVLEQKVNNTIEKYSTIQNQKKQIEESFKQKELQEDNQHHGVLGKVSSIIKKIKLKCDFFLISLSSMQEDKKILKNAQKDLQDVRANLAEIEEFRDWILAKTKEVKKEMQHLQNCAEIAKFSQEEVDDHMVRKLYFDGDITYVQDCKNNKLDELFKDIASKIERVHKNYTEKLHEMNLGDDAPHGKENTLQNTKEMNLDDIIKSLKGSGIRVLSAEEKNQNSNLPKLNAKTSRRDVL